MPLVKCPECGHRQIIASEMAGLYVMCKKCEEGFWAKEDRSAEPAPTVRERTRDAGQTAVVVLAGVGLIACLLLVVGGGFAAFLWLRGPKPPAGPAPSPVASAEPTPTVPPVAKPSPRTTRPTAPSQSPPAEPGPTPAPFQLPGNLPVEGRIEREDTPVGGGRRSDPLSGIGTDPSLPKQLAATADDPPSSGPGGQPRFQTDTDGFVVPRDNAQTATLAKNLKSKDADTRLQAARALGKVKDLGEYGRALCDATTDPVPAVAAAALESLEKVRPDLHRLVSVLVLERSLERHTQAVDGIGALGGRGGPAVGHVLRFLNVVVPLADRASQTDRATRVNDEVFFPDRLRHFAWVGVTTLQRTSAADREYGELLDRLARSTHWPAGDRSKAIQAFASWAGNDPAKKKRLLGVLQVALPDPAVQLTAIDVTRDLGPDARVFAPILRQLKLSSVEAVRMAAGQALTAVGGP